MHVVVPYSPDAPKTRLEPVLSATERSKLARTMLEDVLESVRASGHKPTVLSTQPLEIDAPVTVDDRSLTDAVNGVFPTKDEPQPDPVAVVMADLALATSDAFERLFTPEAEVVIAPGRGGGTNAVVVRSAAFHVDYHGDSFRDHRRIADAVGASLETVDSFRLGADVDEPSDLIDVLVHGTGRTADRLRSFGFQLTVDDGGLELVRAAEPQ